MIIQDLQALKRVEQAQIISETIEYMIACKATYYETVAAENELARMLRGPVRQIGQQVINKLMEKGRVPKGDVFLKQIMQYMDKHKPEMKNLLVDSVQRAAERGAEGTVRDAQMAGIDVRFEKLNPEVKRRLANQVFTASDSTLGRIKGDLMEGLRQAYDKGLGIDDAVSLMRDKFGQFEDYELSRIARTEINSAQNTASHDKIKELTNYEQWWTAEDEWVRSSHQMVHGEIVRVGDTFSNGLKHPGDKSGPIEEWVNCRCRPLPFIIPRGMMVPPGKVRFFEDDLIPIGA